MSSSSRFLNDGSAAAPKLSVYLNLDNLIDLRADSAWPGLEGLPRYERLLADGFEGVQLTTDDQPPTGTHCPTAGSTESTQRPRLTPSPLNMRSAATAASQSMPAGAWKMTMRSFVLSSRSSPHPKAIACPYSSKLIARQ